MQQIFIFVSFEIFPLKGTFIDDDYWYKVVQDHQHRRAISSGVVYFDQHLVLHTPKAGQNMLFQQYLHRAPIFLGAVINFNCQKFALPYMIVYTYTCLIFT